MSIKGVGLNKYENYGEQFIEIIKDYIETKEIDISNIEKIDLEIFSRENKENRYKLTYEYYLDGLLLHEIAAKRGYTVNTIINHLRKCEKNGTYYRLVKIYE